MDDSFTHYEIVHELPEACGPSLPRSAPGATLSVRGEKSFFHFNIRYQWPILLSLRRASVMGRMTSPYGDRFRRVGIPQIYHTQSVGMVAPPPPQALRGKRRDI